MKENNTNTPQPGRNRTIARRLTGYWFRKALAAVLLLNILLCLLFSTAIVIWCEQAAVRDADAFVPVESYRAVRVPFSFFPWETDGSARGVRIFSNRYGRPHAVRYDIYYAADGVVYRAAYDVTPALRIAALMFAVLLFVEVLHLLSRTLRAGAYAKKLLAPFTRLATTAESLGRASAAFRPDHLDELRGALDNISAGTLDTRLDVPAEQKELRSLAVAINNMLDRVANAYAAQIRFVSDASHELRTPIAVIQGYAGLLDRWGKHDEKALEEAIAAIKSETENMKQLVERLLFLARGDSGSLVMNPETFDLAELLAETAQDARLIDPDHKYVLDAPPAGALADRAQIKEVIRILIDNAAKYTDAGGTITLRSGCQDGGETNVFASVTDTGAGIAPEDLPRIFDRFVRTDESRARASGGAGLGLAIAKRIVTVSGGYLEAVSRVGIGTRMTVVLPRGTLELPPGEPPDPQELKSEPLLPVLSEEPLETQKKTAGPPDADSIAI